MARTLSPALDEDEDEFPEPPRLRALRRLVTALTVILGLGMVVIAGTVAWRLWSAAPPARPVEAAALALPADATLTTIGASASEILATIRRPDGSEALLTFRRADGALLSTTPIRRE